MRTSSSKLVIASASLAFAALFAACGDSSEDSDWAPGEPDSGVAGASGSGAGGQAGGGNGGTSGHGGTSGGAGTAGAAGEAGSAGANVGGSAGAGGAAPPKEPTCAADAQTGFYCGGDKVDNADPDTLYTCDGPGGAVVKEQCSLGCVVAPAGYDDYCKKPEATCAANASTGDYCGGDKVDNADPNTLYHCTGPGPATVKQKCAEGCVVAPPGQDDYCKSSSVYNAPWTCGETHTCSNGNHTISHDGKDEYAFDFAMSVGTTLRSMRAGKVLRTRLVSSPGDPCYDGGGSSCANAANTVEVIHSDGTVALYMHLSSISVSTGQAVAKGAVIGKSGNSGWSTGPHLHLQVQENCGIWWCQSVPFKLAEAPNLSGGTSVKSQNCN